MSCPECGASVGHRVVPVTWRGEATKVSWGTTAWRACSRSLPAVTIDEFQRAIDRAERAESEVRKLKAELKRAYAAMDGSEE